MPFLRLLFPLSLGICAGFHLPVPEEVWLLPLLALCLMVLLSVTPFFRRRYALRWLFGALLFVHLFSLGGYRAAGSLLSLSGLAPGDGSLLLAELVDDPKEKPRSFAVEVSVRDTTMGGGDYSLLLYVAKDSASASLRRGDVVAFPNDLFRRKGLNPGEFDYDAMLRSRGISGTCYLAADKWCKVGHRDRFSLRAAALQLQRALLDKLSRYGMEGDEMALVSAMVLGNRDRMDAALRNSYSVTGASHILAVSGLHVGVVFVVLDFVLKTLFRSRMRIVRFFLLLASLWVYAFVTGLPASVVRASFMLSFICVGKMLNRSSSTFNTVSASAFFMLLYHPFYLFDVGFQLSYAAVFSILFFQPKIESFFEPRVWLVGKVWSLLSVSLAAQLGTLPIVLYYFHQFPNYFWLSGLWVVPLSAVVIYASLFFFALPVGVLCEWVVRFLTFVAWLMNAGVQWMEGLPCALVSGIRCGGVEVFLSYVLVVVFAVLLFRRNLRWVRCFALSLAFVSLIWGANGCRLSLREGVAVYNVKGVSAVNRYGFGRNDLSCVGDGEAVCRIVSPFWVDHGFPEPKSTDSSFFFLGRGVVYCLRDTSWRTKVAESPLAVDVLVLGRDAVGSLSDALRLFSFRQLVLDSSNSWRVRRRISRECEERGVACWDVAESGAWVREL